MKLIVAIAILGLLAPTFALDMASDEDFPAFQQFMATYNRRYNTQSEVRGRFAIFKENLLRIQERNSKGAAVHGINKFADIHPNEFRAQYTGYRPRNSPLDSSNIKNFSSYTLDGALTTINWAEKGATTPVKNQGQCGSCWAFSATEQIESDIYLSTGTLYTLSPQQIVSCDTVDLGCNGGNTNTAYQYVMSAGGIEYNKDYHYTSGNTEENGVCKFKKTDVATDITGFKYVSQKASTEKTNMYAQIQESPMSVCVDAEIWQTYVSGVITTASGCGTQLDHCVQIVGANAKENYWIVRNSWATDWGEDGYIYVQAGHNNCGIATDVTVVSPN